MAHNSLQTGSNMPMMTDTIKYSRRLIRAARNGFRRIKQEPMVPLNVCNIQKNGICNAREGALAPYVSFHSKLNDTTFLPTLQNSHPCGLTLGLANSKYLHVLYCMCKELFKLQIRHILSKNTELYTPPFTHLPTAAPALPRAAARPTTGQRLGPPRV